MRKILSSNVRPYLPVLVLFLIALTIIVGRAMSQLQKQPVEESEVQAVDPETKELLQTIRNEQLRASDPEKVVQAIKRLGEMKSAAAIDDLIRLLTFRHRFSWETDDESMEIQPIQTGNRYPATSALFQIGEPALPALIEVIQTQESGSLESENAIYTLMTIFIRTCSG